MGRVGNWGAKSLWERGRGSERMWRVLGSCQPLTRSRIILEKCFLPGVAERTAGFLLRVLHKEWSHTSNRSATRDSVLG